MNDTTRLTPEREAEIAARAEAASRGPWTLDYESCDCSEYCGHGVYVSRIRTGAGPATELSDLPNSEWELMAHARQDVPTLLAELAAVRAERDQARRVFKELACQTCKGSGLDPNDEGDWDSAVGRHNPTTIGPCPTCMGSRTQQPAAGADDPNDNRRRIYLDGKGNGWISICHDEGTEWVVPVQPEAAVEKDIRDIADETGSLREIGRCW
ncbi:hypothetical protein [Streptomyces longwoodensis]|uniref:hypothetical protein n=1 Tax=Streptomyces longwoodensis TaxID=68231 RepID=UPI00225722F2|nr:hypothetical protein [Streptomyces longwoodensis]MCX5000929.1 hypothetical protein [Streptomyces longwoodensis]